MTSQKSPPEHRAGSHRAAFTLIELIIVITIIAILASLTLQTFGFANKKAARSKTTAQLKSIEMGLEDYFTDYGEYPSPQGPSAATPSGYESMGAVMLYQILSGDGSNAIVGGDTSHTSDGEISTGGGGGTEEFPIFDTIHGDDKFGQVDSDGASWWLVDGFGNPWQYATPYSTANIAGSKGGNTGAGSGSAGDPVNQTYDLWSFADDEDITSSGWKPAKWISNW